jgi:hypothetical protein
MQTLCQPLNSSYKPFAGKRLEILPRDELLLFCFARGNLAFHYRDDSGPFLIGRVTGIRTNGLTRAVT